MSGGYPGMMGGGGYPGMMGGIGYTGTSSLQGKDPNDFDKVQETAFKI
jgi:hypothetical protein